MNLEKEGRDAQKKKEKKKKLVEIGWIKKKGNSYLKDEFLCLLGVDNLTPPPVLLHDIPDQLPSLSHTGLVSFQFFLSVLG